MTLEADVISVLYNHHDWMLYSFAVQSFGGKKKVKDIFYVNYCAEKLHQVCKGLNHAEIVGFWKQILPKIRKHKTLDSYCLSCCRLKPQNRRLSPLSRRESEPVKELLRSVD